MAKEPNPSEDAALLARLRRLGRKIDDAESASSPPPRPGQKAASDGKAMAQAFRMSAEFVSGVAAGAIVGYVADKLAGIAPWGLIVGLLLGFCAGMLNLMRAAGLVKPSKLDRDS